MKLSDLIDSVSLKNYNTACYLDKERGEIVLVTKEELRAAEEDDDLEDYLEWQKERIRLARDIQADEKEGKYIALPDEFAMHEYSTMENFCLSIEDEEISKSLCRAIRGRGAFRRFKDGIHRCGVADDWYKFRYDAMRKIVIDWCEANNIEYVEA